MAGIISYGAYIPRYRLSRMTVFMNMGWFNPVTMGVAQGEKAVANWDEDSITMAYSAAQDCIKGFDRESVQALYLASTSLPYRERQNAGILATALDLKPAVRTADFTDSLKSGTTALLSGLETVMANGDSTALVASSDVRLGNMGSVQEMYFGDGGAAFLLGNKDVIAELKGSYSLSYDFVDHFRGEGREFDRMWEERWIRDIGYGRIIPMAMKGLLEKTGMKIEDFAKVVYSCPISREHAGIAKRAKMAPEQVQPNLFEQVGDTGTPHSLIMLAAALDEAKPGDKIMVVSYGSGADALCFEVTKNIEKMKDHKSVNASLERRADLTAYTRYCVFRDLIPVDVGLRGEIQPPTAFSTLWRKRQGVLGLVGSKCKKCGTPMYPAQNICVNPECLAVEEMEPYRFSDKKATIFSFTGDMLAASVDPPAVYGIIDFEGGGRMVLDFTDCTVEDAKVGLPVELTFRRKYIDPIRGISGYFWKAIPITG